MVTDSHQTQAHGVLSITHKQFQHAFMHQIFKVLKKPIFAIVQFVSLQILLKPQITTTPLICHRKEGSYQLQFPQSLRVTCVDVETNLLLDLMHD